MPGYASKVTMSNGRFYVPEVPRILKWPERLRKWEARAKDKYGWSDADNVKSDCMDMMQLHYPGSYTLEWREVNPMEWHLDLAFTEPKDKTIWMLRYGDK